MALQPRVLVIDDDPLFRNLIAGLLKSSYAVTIAESGPEGYQLAMDQPPQVVLIDVQMPGWNGLETLQTFRNHPTLSLTKIAMLTADASRKTVVTAIRGGADEYIVKTNFSRNELLRKLQSLVAKSSVPMEADFARDENSPCPLCSAEWSRHDSRRPAPAARVENECDPRLQEMIDDWE